MNTAPLPACCMDFDIELLHLLFPDLLPPDGREFVDAHGIWNVKLKDLMAGAVDMGEGVVKIKHRCKQLANDGRCKIYASRPRICRNFDCATRNDCACMGQGLIQVQ